MIDRFVGFGFVSHIFGFAALLGHLIAGLFHRIRGAVLL